MNVLDVVSVIAKEVPLIKRLRVFEFQSSPLLQQRIDLQSGVELDLLESALALKKNSKLPFWEALMTSIAKSGVCAPSMIRATLMHQSNLSYQEVLIDDLAAYMDGHQAHNIAANSGVLLSDGEIAHLPLLDFKMPVSDKALITVEECIRQIGLKGYVLDSGRSYHFWGRELISADQLIKVLARFVLLHPISDKSWAAHQLIEGSASLRISERYGRLPEVVSEVG